jgi:monothiol glutaredoxin
MSRIVLSDSKIEPKALNALRSFHPDVLQQVVGAVGKDPIVVVGMAHNPFVRRVRRALSQAGLSFTYLEYGNYFTQWKQRLAIKLWSGWPTFPQVFVQGRLVGGCTDVERALATGEFKAWLAQK